MATTFSGNPKAQPTCTFLLFLLFCLSHLVEPRIIRLTSEDTPSDLFYSDAKEVNFRPLIGILSQPMEDSDIEGTGMSDANASYIAASYVKWVEMAGARAVPILYHEPEDQIRMKFNSINGLIFPGGATDLVDSPFYRAAVKLFQMVVEANDRGDYFPLYATCLGLELVTIIVSKNFTILQQDFSSENYASTLNFAGEWAKKRSVFTKMPSYLIDKLENDTLTMENHGSGTTPDRFLSSPLLSEFFHILTTTKDKNEVAYVSTVESKKYPIYGSQWHPEKNAFEWKLSNIPHNGDAVQVTQSVANFLVSEARKSKHSPSINDMQRIVIYNYDPIYTGKEVNDSFEQTYMFFNNESLPSRSIE